MNKTVIIININFENFNTLFEDIQQAGESCEITLHGLTASGVLFGSI